MGPDRATTPNVCCLTFGAFVHDTFLDGGLRDVFVEGAFPVGLAPGVVLADGVRATLEGGWRVLCRCRLRLVLAHDHEAAGAAAHPRHRRKGGQVCAGAGAGARNRVRHGARAHARRCVGSLTRRARHEPGLWPRSLLRARDDGCRGETHGHQDPTANVGGRSCRDRSASFGVESSSVRPAAQPANGLREHRSSGPHMAGTTRYGAAWFGQESLEGLGGRHEASSAALSSWPHDPAVSTVSGRIGKTCWQALSKRTRTTAPGVSFRRDTSPTNTVS